jgi:hypothetical protein
LPQIYKLIAEKQKIGGVIAKKGGRDEYFVFLGEYLGVSNYYLKYFLFFKGLVLSVFVGFCG